MNLHILDKIINYKNNNIKQLAILVDPDRSDDQHLSELVGKCNRLEIDFFFVGGSYLSISNTERVVKLIKDHSDIPCVLFPGSPLQICASANAILLLSLISGRNPDLLIGRHVEAAPLLRQINLEIIPTGYILIDGGRATSVSYISNTMPIPADKQEIAAFTALAGTQLGLRLIYMDAGSGALYSIPPATIAKVRQFIDVPLIIGGGIRSKTQLHEAYLAGADLVVIGNALEKDIRLLEELVECKEAFSQHK
jgi:putative glycerol-1-phosphate prenyltransferase